MAGLYLDTSALGRVLLAEPDAVAIVDVLGEFDTWWFRRVARAPRATVADLLDTQLLFPAVLDAGLPGDAVEAA